MPKKIRRDEAERKIKNLLGLPSYVNILKVRLYKKEYYSQKFGWREYTYFMVNYYDPTTQKVYRKHIKVKPRELETKILRLWRLELKQRHANLTEIEEKELNLLLTL